MTRERTDRFPTMGEPHQNCHALLVSGCRGANHDAWPDQAGLLGFDLLGTLLSAHNGFEGSMLGKKRIPESKERLPTHIFLDIVWTNSKSIGAKPKRKPWRLVDGSGAQRCCALLCGPDASLTESKQSTSETVRYWSQPLQPLYPVRSAVLASAWMLKGSDLCILWAFLYCFGSSARTL